MSCVRVFICLSVCVRSRSHADDDLAGVDRHDARDSDTDDDKSGDEKSQEGADDKPPSTDAELNPLSVEAVRSRYQRFQV
jgi:hypothetical protein